jgi:hypothetical protein
MRWSLLPAIEIRERLRAPYDYTSSKLPYPAVEAQEYELGRMEGAHAFMPAALKKEFACCGQLRGNFIGCTFPLNVTLGLTHLASGGSLLVRF